MVRTCWAWSFFSLVLGLLMLVGTARFLSLPMLLLWTPQLRRGTSQRGDSFLARVGSSCVSR
jgi:hypothetical protein